jgi:hypothetical protein
MGFAVMGISLLFQYSEYRNVPIKQTADALRFASAADPFKIPGIRPDKGRGKIAINP